MSLFSAIGGMFGANKAAKSADADRRYQKLFAKEGIQWRVQDAKAAGIHPLAALGASTPGYIPVNDQSGALMGDAIGNAGAAIEKKIDPLRKAQIELTEAQRDLFRAQSRTIINDLRTVGTGGAGPRMNSTDPDEAAYINRNRGNRDVVTVKSGESAEVFSGSDLDEILGGVVEELYVRGSKAYERRKLKRAFNRAAETTIERMRNDRRNEAAEQYRRNQGGRIGGPSIRP